MCMVIGLQQIYVCLCVCVFLALLCCCSLILHLKNSIGTILGGRQVHICGAMQESHVGHFVGEGAQQTHGDPD